MTRSFGRGSALLAALPLGLLLAVPAAGPAAQAVRFDLWSGTWRLGFHYPNPRGDAIVTLALGADGRVRNVGGEISVITNPPQGLSLQAVLNSTTMSSGAPPGQSILDVRLTPGETGDEHSDFHYLRGDSYNLGGAREATVLGFYGGGGPERAVVSTTIARSSRIADVGDRVEFRVTFANQGPSGIPRGGARARLSLNAEPANVRTVARGRVRTGRVAPPARP